MNYACLDDCRPSLPSLSLLFWERILRWDQRYKFSISSRIPRWYRHSRSLQSSTTSRRRRHDLEQATSLLQAEKLSENTIETATIVCAEKHTFERVRSPYFQMATYPCHTSQISVGSQLSSAKNPRVDQRELRRRGPARLIEVQRTVPYGTVRDGAGTQRVKGEVHPKNGNLTIRSEKMHWFQWWRPQVDRSSRSRVIPAWGLHQIFWHHDDVINLPRLGRIYDVRENDFVWE